MYTPKVIVPILTNMTVAQVLLQELTVSRHPGSVLKEIYQILGILIKILPQKLKHLAEDFVPRLIRILNDVVTKNSNPNVPVVIGALKGLYHALQVFDLDQSQGFILYSISL